MRACCFTHFFGESKFDADWIKYKRKHLRVQGDRYVPDGPTRQQSGSAIGNLYDDSLVSTPTTLAASSSTNRQPL